MLTGFLILMTFELLGESLQAAFHLPVPGPVLGMFLLALVLVAAEKSTVPAVTAMLEKLRPLSQSLLSWMGLFFVPVGSGLLAERDLLARAWLPILAAVTGSTVISILTTGLVMHFFLRPQLARTRHRPGQMRP